MKKNIFFLKDEKQIKNKKNEFSLLKTFLTPVPITQFSPTSGNSSHNWVVTVQWHPLRTNKSLAGGSVIPLERYMNKLVLLISCSVSLSREQNATAV